MSTPLPQVLLPCRRRPFRGLIWLTSVFVALSGLDLLLTRHLLESPDSGAYEANPVAALLLEQFGWGGLAAYKLACLTVVLGVVALVSRWRPATARRVLALGCGVLLVVVGYSAVLPHLECLDAEGQQLLEVHLVRRAQLSRKLEKMQLFFQKTDALAEEMALQHLPLERAVDQLEAYLSVIDFDPMPLIRSQAGMSDVRACLAAKLVRNAGFLRREYPHLPQQSLARLAQAFERHYHRRLPEFSQETYGPKGM